MLEAANLVLNQYSQGNAELGLEQVDPLKVDNMTVVQEAGPVTLKAKFRDLDLRGLSKAVVYKVSGFDKEPGNSKLEIRLKTPLASAVGPYKVDGRVLVLPIGGEGIIKLNFGEFNFRLQVQRVKIRF